MNVIASGKQQITSYSGNKYTKGDYIAIEDVLNVRGQGKAIL